MAREKSAVRESSIDAVAAKFGKLLESEEQPAGAGNTSDAGQGTVEDEDPETDAELGDAEDEESEDEPQDDDPEPEDEEDEPEAESDDEDSPPELKTKKVKDAHSGKEVEIEEEEAKNGYLRLQDYTRKSQANAQARKELEAELTQAREKREAYARQLDDASTYLNQLVPKEPEWATLRATKTPEEYGAIRAQWDEFSALKNKIKSEQEKVDKDRLAEAEKEYTSYIAGETQKLLEKRPEWKDPAKFVKARNKLVGWLGKQGWSEEQVGQITDHRLAIHLYDAMEYDAAKRGAPKPKIGARRSGIRTAPPGPAGSAPRSATKPEKQQATLKRLSKTGKLDDAARHFETLL